MKILVARLLADGSILEGYEPASILAWEAERFVRVRGDISYRFSVEHVSEELVVHGEMALAADIQCSRCSEFFSTSIRVSDFLRAYPLPEETEEVDITEDMREEFYLHVPAFPVCANACVGMCTQCGVNLNHGTCDCVEEEKPNPWSALDGLNL